MSKQPDRYRFFIQTKTGEVIEWLNLSEHQAKRLNSLTGKTVAWSGVNSFGWEVMK